jgi:hypothetical protein
MRNGDQSAREARSYAGFCLRTRNRTWFWGWGGSPVATEQPWAGVAEWLRRLRAQTAPAGSNNHAASQEIEIKDGQTAAGSRPFIQPAKQAPTGKPKLRFVCDRHFIGFVLR